MKSLLPIALALVVAAPAQAATYRVTSATHTSTSKKAVEGYTGVPTSTWKLAKPSKKADNRLMVRRTPAFTSVLGYVNVDGAYTIDVTTRFVARARAADGAMVTASLRVR